MIAENLLVVLLLGGLLGMAGQRIRVIAGIKKRHDAGYAGADFIEAFMSRSKLPGATPAAGQGTGSESSAVR